MNRLFTAIGIASLALALGCQTTANRTPNGTNQGANAAEKNNGDQAQSQPANQNPATNPQSPTTTEGTPSAGKNTDTGKAGSNQQPPPGGGNPQKRGAASGPSASKSPKH